MLGDGHPDTIQSINDFGGLLNKLKRFDEALPLLEGGEQTARKISTGKNIKRLANYLTKLGHAQTGKGLFAEAETTLLEAYPLFLDGFGPNHKLTQACITRIVDLYTAWDAADPGKGYDAKSEVWQAKLDGDDK